MSVNQNQLGKTQRDWSEQMSLEEPGKRRPRSSRDAARKMAPGERPMLSDRTARTLLVVFFGIEKLILAELVLIDQQGTASIPLL